MKHGQTQTRSRDARVCETQDIDSIVAVTLYYESPKHWVLMDYYRFETVIDYYLTHGTS